MKWIVRRAVNEEEITAELDRRTAGWGGRKAFAERVGIHSSHLISMTCGRRLVNMRVANELGYELRWVRRQPFVQRAHGDGGHGAGSPPKPAGL